MSNELTPRQQQAELARQDSRVAEKFAEALSDFCWDVNRCGEDGQKNLEKAREHACDLIKRLVNYI